MWIQQVRLIMEMYVEKTDGSIIIEKESEIVWSFKQADYQFGKLQATELASYLKNVFENLQLNVFVNKHSVQVRPLQHRRDKFMRTLLEQEISKLDNKTPIDFLMYIGEDQSCEQNMKYLSRLQLKQRKIQK
jgi:trehalose 6-phosphate synthase/phosphatase